MLQPPEESLACAHLAVEETKVQGESGSDGGAQPCGVTSNLPLGGALPSRCCSPRSACFRRLLLAQAVFLVSLSPFPASAVGSSFCLTCFHLLQAAVTGLRAAHVKLSLASLWGRGGWRGQLRVTTLPVVVIVGRRGGLSVPAGDRGTSQLPLRVNSE